MSSPGAGIKGGYIQLAPEVNYGQQVVATQRLDFLNGECTPELAPLVDESLDGNPSPKTIEQGGLYYKFRFLFVLNFEGMLELKRGVSGAYAITNVEAGVNDHFFREGKTLKAYTIEMVEGDTPPGKCQVLLGAKFLTQALRGTSGTGADAMYMMEVTGTARNVLPNQTLTGALSSPTTLRALWSHAVTFNDGIADTVPGITNYASLTTAVSTATVTNPGGAGNPSFLVNVKPGMTLAVGGLALGVRTVLSVQSATSLTLDANSGFLNSGVAGQFQSLQRVKSFEIMLENPADTTRFYPGSLNPDEQVRNGKIKATFKFVQEFVTLDQFLAAQASTTGSPQIILRHPTGIGAVSFREIEVRAKSAKLVGFTKPVQGPGVIISTGTWQAFYDPTDLTAFYMRVRNTQATLP